MSEKQDRQDNVQYSSANIGKKKAPDYFEGRVQENRKNKFLKALKDAFSGKRKFIIIGIGCAIIATLVVLILWLTVWSQSSSVDPEIAWSNQLDSIQAEAYDILNSDQDNTYVAAIAFLDEEIAKESVPSKVIDLRLMKTDFLNNNGGAQMALPELLAINEDSLNEDQLIHLWTTIRFACYEVGDEALAETYQSKITNYMIEGWE